MNKTRYLSDDIDFVALDICHWRESKEFYTPDGIETPAKAEAMLGKLMLVTSEVGEMAEAVRDLDHIHFSEEMADTFIRLLDICGTMNIKIAHEIRKKMLVNEKRPTKHNRKTNL